MVLPIIPSSRIRSVSRFIPIALLASCAAPEESVYVETLGTDTLAVEAFTRTANRIEGTVVTRSPVTRVSTYTAELSPEGAIDRLEVRVSTPAENPDGPAAGHLVTTFVGDSAVTVRESDGRTDTVRVQVPGGTIPAVAKDPLPIAFTEYAIRRALVSGRDSLAISVLPAGSRRVASNAVVRRAADVVSLDYHGDPMYARVDEEGRVLEMSGRETTLKVETQMAATPIDLERLAAEYAERDARGDGFGVASPRATVQASGGGANFEVDYGRPAKRGRVIFGGLVAWETVWRTGANAATHFSTDRNLRIGSARIPAGTYTLWTTFSPESATLIINEQTGQWGTQYDASQDLVRVPLTKETLAEPVERFTIAIDEASDGGILRLMWDRDEYRVVMQVTR